MTGTPVLLRAAPARPGARDYRHQARLGAAALNGAPAVGVLALNFHEVPPADRKAAREQIIRIADRGVGFDPDRPADDGLHIKVAFYDGCRDTAYWGAEQCNRVGLRAFFYPVERTHWEPTPRLTDDDLAGLAAEGHELCFHTATHRASANLLGDLLTREVADPMARLTAAAGRPPRLAAWLGGTRYDGSPANRLAAALGVRHITSNWSVEPIPTATTTTAAARQPQPVGAS